VAVKHVSPSSWKTWAECPKKWAARYVHEVGDKAGPEAVAGSTFHLAADVLYDHPPSMRGADLREACSEAATELYVEEFVEAGGKAEELRPFVDECFLGLSGIEFASQVDVVSTEETFEGVKLNGVPVKIVTDRVQRVKDGRQRPVLKLVDYKSGKKRPARQQMVMGAAVIEQKYGEKVPKAELYYVRFGEAHEVLTGPAAQSSVLDQLAEAWDEMRAAVVDDHFPAKPSPLCPWCAVFESCEQGKRYVRQHGNRRKR
jgi:CRISPR/Cas system-associated exonuclease Cas4 (RecB family)